MRIEEFVGALEESWEVPAGTLRPEFPLHSLGCWDSMAALVFMSLADKRLKVNVSGAEVQECKTVQDLIDLVGNTVLN
jgi:acyl carrier protein